MLGTNSKCLSIVKMDTLCFKQLNMSKLFGEFSKLGTPNLLFDGISDCGGLCFLCGELEQFSHQGFVESNVGSHGKPPLHI